MLCAEPSGFVTCAPVLPAVAVGAVNPVSAVEETTMMFARSPDAQSDTTVPATKLVPVAVTRVPPPVGPLEGEIAEIVGFQ